MPLCMAATTTSAIVHTTCDTQRVCENEQRASEKKIYFSLTPAYNVIHRARLYITADLQRCVLHCHWTAVVGPSRWPTRTNTNSPATRPRCEHSGHQHVEYTRTGATASSQPYQSNITRGQELISHSQWRAHGATCPAMTSSGRHSTDLLPACLADAGSQQHAVTPIAGG